MVDSRDSNSDSFVTRRRNTKSLKRKHDDEDDNNGYMKDLMSGSFTKRQLNDKVANLKKRFRKNKARSNDDKEEESSKKFSFAGVMLRGIVSATSLFSFSSKLVVKKLFSDN
ncbi:unnamed protein product [Microthlaspi erraticum]|uniref:Uncharacterized protein n=1 Tax=Microthlaspi erraticum TaxID=1685480 RepID=A0A6D2KFB9_9BRAS|nr:unnamed protein product [Microthlaspi erraticum]